MARAVSGPRAPSGLVDDVADRLRRDRHRPPSRPGPGRASPWCCRAARRPGAATSAWPTGGAAAIDWALVDIYMGDERCVGARRPRRQPTAGPRSADRPGRRPVGSFHPMSCDAGARVLRAARLGGSTPSTSSTSASAPTATPPRCSPTPPPSTRPRDGWWCARSTPTDRNPHARMTLTLEGLARARLVVFTVAGEAKHDALAASCRPGPTFPPPASGRARSSGSSTARPPARPGPTRRRARTDRVAEGDR